MNLGYASTREITISFYLSVVYQFSWYNCALYLSNSSQKTLFAAISFSCFSQPNTSHPVSHVVAHLTVTSQFAPHSFVGVSATFLGYFATSLFLCCF